MSAWLGKKLEENGPIWLVVIVVVLMVGPTGIERMFNRIFPPAVAPSPGSPAPSVDFAAQLRTLSETTDYQFAAVVANQDKIIEILNEVARDLNTAQLDQIRLDLRITSLERFTQFPGKVPRSPAETLP